VDLAADAELLWVGFSPGDPGPRDVRIIRAPRAQGGAFWLSEDSAPYDAASAVDSYLSLDSAPTQSIFNLPNGLQAYLIEGSDDTLSTITANHRACCNDGLSAITTAACHACHDAGLLPLANQAREIIDRYPGYFVPLELATLQARYPAASELEALLEADNAVQQAALAEGGFGVGARNSLSDIFHRFERDPLTLHPAAAELGVHSSRLQQTPGELSPELQPLTSGGSVDRATFTAAFGTTLCRLHGLDRNVPAHCP
jgi:hypothetical protein